MTDPALYDDLATQWWQPRGAFAMLHWLAAARARLIPSAQRTGAVLADLGCGAGLLAPHIEGKGYLHVGVDLSTQGPRLAAKHGVAAIRGDVLAVPLRPECADVVVLGEILEHVPDLGRAVAQACGILRPGGLLVLDTLADTALCKWLAIDIAERLPQVPRGLHVPSLLVNREELVRECARQGVTVRLRGIRPSLTDLAGWVLRVRPAVRMVTVPTTAVLFQGVGMKES
ncbi:class I SAM-dependent methyltransferase [Actinokineospora iranica]|uniref:2-polyprenyl-6-hydroxyphenyl methylase / 3-demethylubiquinone-9 3-methyltransferase n=1 Tax=Actinokineospora iranica TaxID=1271860 RepID=A0A1G6WH61_9PSEU|nr:methyltransferase domain-containing protein [Actinokineospora iranica]SDD65290.1 2-polyprenyl-6-hydroxyphenyl methylase / 3-demethylubiquinone-9 3-methyltransferase [Actinokineospora iranica]